MRLFWLVCLLFVYACGDITRLLTFIDILIVNKVENPKMLDNLVFVEHLKKYNRMLHRLHDNMQANMTGTAAMGAIVEDIINKRHKGIHALQLLIENNTLRSHLGLSEKQSVMVWNLVSDINLVSNHMKEMTTKQFTKYPEYWRAN